MSTETFTNAKDRTTTTVDIVMSDVSFDVYNKTHLTGLSRETLDNYAEVAHMQASEDSEAYNQIMRSIRSAYGNLVSELSEYLDPTNIQYASNYITTDMEGNFSLVFMLPVNFNNAARGMLPMGVHDYLVDKAIADWFTITNKADAADYVALAAEQLTKLHKALSKRTRPKRYMGDE